MGRRSDPGWRDRDASRLMAEALPALPLDGPVLVVDDPEEAAAEAVTAAGHPLARWNRMDTPGGPPGTPWPTGGPYAASLIRLPRSREALELALHAAASVTRSGGWIAVYGAKDEGIASTPRRLEPLLTEVATVANARRCRVLVGRWEGREGRPDTRFRLEGWRRTAPVLLGDGPIPWVSYPGTFAGGELDPGTALLVRHLPGLPPGCRVLDFAAGTGVLAAALLRRDATTRPTLVEPDALAREAARENVPGARFLSAEEWGGGESFQAVVSNPPYHRGKEESLEVVESLIRQTPGVLAPGGELRVVVQRRLPVEGLLREAFTEVEAVADEGPYRVWRAAGR